MNSTWADLTQYFPRWTDEVAWPDGSYTPGRRSSREVRKLLGDVSLAGRRVYDIGCQSGASALAIEQLGAAVVVAVEWQPQYRLQFEELRRAFRTRVQYHSSEIAALPPEWEPADVVMAIDTYTRLEDPVGGLRRLWDLTSAVMVLVGEVANGGWDGVAAACWRPDGGAAEAECYWLPTAACLRAWCEVLPGVERAERIWPFYGDEYRAAVRLWRVEMPRSEGTER